MVWSPNFKELVTVTRSSGRDLLPSRFRRALHHNPWLIAFLKALTYPPHSLFCPGHNNDIDKEVEGVGVKGYHRGPAGNAPLPVAPRG